MKGEIWGIAAIGVAAYFLLKKTSVGKVADVAATVATDIVNLPQNVVTLVGLIPQLPMAVAQAMSKPLTQQSIFDAAIQGKIATFPGTASISQRTANMINSVYHRYPGITATNWAQVAVANGAKFDANGFIISDNLS
jgi:ABC-type glucose/galactose transport system permease subunit